MSGWDDYLKSFPVVDSGHSNLAIYMAGKIAADDWRVGLVPQLADYEWDGYHWPYWEEGVMGFPSLGYVGPFFSRGVQRDTAYVEHGVPFSETGVWKHYGDTLSARDRIREQCLQAIRAADLVFAWIDSPDCHGTLFELGSRTAMEARNTPTALAASGMVRA